MVDVLGWPSLALVHRVHVGRTDRGGVNTHEGLAVTGDAVLLLPEDDPARVFTVRLFDRTAARVITGRRPSSAVAAVLRSA